MTHADAKAGVGERAPARGGCAAVETDQLAPRLYAEGAADYLDVVTAQTAELQVRRAYPRIRTQRLIAGIDLMRALRGGWTAQTYE